MEHIDKYCTTCKITLTEFEVQEYKHQCIDCYKEEHNTQKTSKAILPVLIKRGRKRVFTA